MALTDVAIKSTNHSEKPVKLLDRGGLICFLDPTEQSTGGGTIAGR